MQITKDKRCGICVFEMISIITTVISIFSSLIEPIT